MKQYQNIYIENRHEAPTIHLWHDNDTGNRTYQKITDYKEKVFLKTRGASRYETIYGDAVKPVVRPVSYKAKERAKQHFDKPVVFENDVSLEHKFLTETFESDEPSNGHRLLYFDIEVSMENELPDTRTGNNPITSIAAYDSEDEKRLVFILSSKMNDDEITDEDGNVISVRVFDREYEMLRAFIEYWRGVDPSIIVGYNSDDFDIPYLCHRINTIFGEDTWKTLSPIEKGKYRKRNNNFTFAGIASLDYIRLYKNFTFSKLSSYSLENVAQTVLGKGKIKYKGLEYEDEGETRVVNDLDDLYELDKSKFLRYNMEDVMLLVEMENKLGFIELARSISHMGSSPYEDIYMSSRWIDGIIYNWLNRRNMVSPRKRDFNLPLKKAHSEGEEVIQFDRELPKYIPERGRVKIQKTKTVHEVYRYHSRDKHSITLENPLWYDVKKNYSVKLDFEGAYVKEPDPGKYEWVYDLDLTSMYPSIIMTLNISPETKRGKIWNWDAKKYLNGNPNDEYEVYWFDSHTTVTMSRDELKNQVHDNEYAISSSGTFYDTSERGVIAQIVEEWFDKRVRYKGIRNDWREKIKTLEEQEKTDTPEYENAVEQEEYYDDLQHNYKIALNSFYGVLGLSVFRYYDVDNAESVTHTGRDTIQYTQVAGDKIYNNIMNTTNVDHYEIDIEDETSLSLKPNEKLPVMRNDTKQNIHAVNLREGDEVLMNEFY